MVVFPAKGDDQVLISQPHALTLYSQGRHRIAADWPRAGGSLVPIK